MPPFKRLTVRRLLLAAILGLVCATDVARSEPAAVAQSEPVGVAGTEVERGQDYAVLQNISLAPGPSGSMVMATNRFTLLENCMHYSEEGQWRQSEDLIESFPEGAIARRGPNKAVFSPELNTQVVFDILASDGRRLQGGIRAIQLTDIRAGRSIVLGLVKQSVLGRLLPPNQLVWQDAFTGIKADVVMVWKHNLFSQDVVLLEQPVIPAGWDPRATRLEVVTEFFVEAEPELRKSTVKVDGLPAIEDHAVIHFGALAMVMGKAFGSADGKALEFGAFTTEGTTVVKQWQSTEDGRRFLVESVAWPEVQAAMAKLPAAQQANHAAPGSREKLLATGWGARPSLTRDPRPMEVASLNYQPRGLLIDFTIIPDGSGTPGTFAAGTYYIKTSYYSGSSVTFSPNCVIKFKNNAYLLAYGPIYFPASVTTSSMPVFTSRNDDSIGEVIQGVAGETDSNGDPTLHKAAQSLWIYYSTFTTEVRNARFIWSKVGIQRDRNTGSSASLFLHDCLFYNILGSGTAGFVGDAAWVSVSNLKKCNVSTPGLTMTTDCIGIENSLPGTESWKITSAATAGWPVSVSSATPQIEGFASTTSVNAGGSIGLYVDVRTGVTSYTIDVFRMGWYGSVGGRKMLPTISKTNGTKQPVPAADSNGMIDCLAGATPWTLSHTLAIPSHWISGVYLAKLRELGSGRESYIIFVVREDGRSSDLYFQTSVTTYQAYNPWGGKSLYNYPTSLARKVSFNRPYAASSAAQLAYGTGAGEFFVMINDSPKPAWEYNALRWMEKQGHDLTYCTSIDTHRTWPAGKSVKAFLSVGHDEYWSPEMRSHVEAKRGEGVNLAFLSANTCFFIAHFDAISDPNHRAFEVNKDPNLYTDQWRYQTTTPNHEISMVGVEYAFNSWDGSLTIPAGLSHPWAYDHTGILVNGLTTATNLSGLLGYELDGHWVGPLDTQGNVIFPSCGTFPIPSVPTWTRLTRTDVNITWAQPAPPRPPCIPAVSALQSCSVISGSGSSGNTFATGSMQWCWGLDDFGYPTFQPDPSQPPLGIRTHNIAKQVTDNVLKTFSGKPRTALIE